MSNYSGNPWVRGRVTGWTVTLSGLSLSPPAKLEVRALEELWVLRSTITLKTTASDTTLVSVDGDIGQWVALVHPPHASPETITETTPSATVTPIPLCHIPTVVGTTKYSKLPDY